VGIDVGTGVSVLAEVIVGAEVGVGASGMSDVGVEVAEGRRVFVGSKVNPSV